MFLKKSPISITRTCRGPGHEPGFATRFATSPFNGNWAIRDDRSINVRAVVGRNLPFHIDKAQLVGNAQVVIKFTIENVAAADSAMRQRHMRLHVCDKGNGGFTSDWQSISLFVRSLN